MLTHTHDLAGIVDGVGGDDAPLGGQGRLPISRGLVIATIGFMRGAVLTLGGGRLGCGRTGIRE
jgi:hypothetical protein